MRRPPTKLIALALLALAVLALSACGGGGASEKTVAVVGKSKITQGTLNHWMATTLGGDYRSLVRTSAPLGLVSDPPKYATCVLVASKIVPSSLGGPKPKRTVAQLRLKCQQLQRAIKEQALSALISVLWRSEEAAELGTGVSEREVNEELQKSAYKHYSNPAQFRRHLAEIHSSLADQRYLTKGEMLSTKFVGRLQAKAASLGGGEATTVKLVHENIAKWSARTSCSPGYVAWQCKQFRASQEASPSASQVIEQLAGV
jgi:hypothetical protein